MSWGCSPHGEMSRGKNCPAGLRQPLVPDCFYLGLLLLPQASESPLEPEALHPEGCHQHTHSKAIPANESPLGSELASLGNSKSLLISDCL